MSRICVCCDANREMEPFRGKTMTIEHKGLKTDVEDLSGMTCPGCGETEFEPDSAVRYAAASDALVIEARRATGRELRRIRKKLNLKQSEAARLTGGGHNAFSRYETGAVDPSPAVVNLFRLLAKHPDDLDELKRA